MPIRPTFSMALNSSLPARVNLCSDDRSKVAEYVNLAQEQLIIDPLAPDEGWYGGFVNMLFNVPVSNFTGYITAPREIARIEVLDICNRPRRIRNGFYEYLQFGTGKQPRPCNQVCRGITQAFERDNVPTLIDFPASGPQTIRIYPSNNADLGKLVQVQGADQNGQTVLGVDPITGAAIIGEQVPLVIPFATAAFKYQTITGLMKDPTLGPVTIFTVDPATGQQTLLSSMEPDETTAAYRRYLLNNIPPHCCNQPTGLVQVDAQCKLDFIPVLNDTDYLIIQNIPALIEQCASIRWSKMDSAQALAKEASTHKKALQLLCGQLDHFYGKTNTAIGMQIFGSDRLRPQPV
jgi:hypothetical protein